jgi:hypothetical protein
MIGRRVSTKSSFVVMRFESVSGTSDDQRQQLPRATAPDLRQAL